MEAINSTKPIKPKMTPEKKRTTIASVAGSAAGIALAVGGIYAISKKGNPNLKFSKLSYSEAGILAIGGGSILGGLLGGLAFDKNKENKIPKIKEALQQFFGSLVCPVGLVAVFSKILEKSKFQMPELKNGTKFLNNTLKALPNVAVTIGSLVLGMHLGNFLMNKVNNKIFKDNEKHTVHASDYLVHTDDMCVAANLILKDVSAINAVTSKVLPAAFILAGAKTGMQEAKPNA